MMKGGDRNKVLSLKYLFYVAILFFMLSLVPTHLVSGQTFGEYDDMDSLNFTSFTFPVANVDYRYETQTNQYLSSRVGSCVTHTLSNDTSSSPPKLDNESIARLRAVSNACGGSVTSRILVYNLTDNNEEFEVNSSFNLEFDYYTNGGVGNGGYKQIRLWGRYDNDTSWSNYLTYFWNGLYPPCPFWGDLDDYHTETINQRIRMTKDDFEACGSTVSGNITKIEFLISAPSTGAGAIDIIDRLYVGNNVQASLQFITPLEPQPTLTNVPISISWSNPEGVDDTVYNEFDCDEDDSVVDYPFGFYDFTSPTFNCTYNETGNYTIKITTSDLHHLGMFNATNYTYVEINRSGESPESGGGCDGFVSPSCSGNCIFFDDFSYSNPIECNGWNGQIKDYLPYSDLSIYNTGTDYNVYIDLEDEYLSELQYDIIEVSFDFESNSTATMQYSVLDGNLNEYYNYLQIRNNKIYVYDYYGSYEISTYSFGTHYDLKMRYNLINDTVDYLIDGVFKETTNYYDLDSDQIRQMRFTWVDSSNIDFSVDDFNVTYVELNEYYNEGLVNQIPYQYNPELFCAINWSDSATGDGTGRRFDYQNCVDRGYSDNQFEISLCVPRACLDDTVSWVFNKAIENTFVTMVVIFMIILLVPIFVAIMVRK